MEGESLFNDASSIVLFQIFFEMVRLARAGTGQHSCRAASALRDTAPMRR